MQSPKASDTHHLEGGLKALKLSPEEDQPPYRTTFRMLSSTEAASSEIGDYIGVESCLDLNEDEEVRALKSTGAELENESHEAYSKCRRKRDQWLSRKKKEFPPPIPLLARTGNLPSHMPWVLKRHYTSDGRLILTEEKVRHHEYFRAHRANGRLTLQLVPMDDDAWLPPSAHEYDCNDTNEEPLSDFEENDQPAHDNDNDNDIVDGGDLVSGDGSDEVEKEIVHKDWSTVVEDSTTKGSAGIGVNVAGKCLNYNNVGSGSSCIFGVPVISAIRTVHI